MTVEIGHFNKQMTSMADLIRQKAGLESTEPLSVTSMISTLLNLTGNKDEEGVSAFLARTLTNLNFPVYAANIGPYAFADCTALETIANARNITYGISAFHDCQAGGEPLNYNENGGTYNKGAVAPEREPNPPSTIDVDPEVKAALLDETGYIDVSLNSEFTSLAATLRAINHTEELLTISSMISAVSTMQAGGTEHVLAKLIDRTVTDLVVPATVNSIGNNALRGCTNLSEIVLPIGMEVINIDALLDCAPNLHLTMYGDVNWHLAIENGGNSRYYCTHVGSAYNDNGVTDYEFETKYWTYDDEGGHETEHIETTTIHMPTVTGEGLWSKHTSYPSYTTYRVDCYKLSKVDFKDVTIVTDEAYKFNQDLVTVDLTGVSYIEDAAFSLCGLTNIIWPTNPLVLGPFAFEYNPITELTIGNNVTYPEKCQFQHCSELTSVAIDTLANTRLAYGMFYGCSKLSAVAVTGKATVIGPSCFAGASSLSDVSLPNTISEIQAYAFTQASSLKTLKFPTGLKKIDSGAFEDCESLTAIDLKNTQVSCIGEEAFYNCYDVSTCVLPATVTFLGADVFKYCTLLNYGKVLELVRDNETVIGTYTRVPDLDGYSVVSELDMYAWQSDNQVYYTRYALHHTGTGEPIYTATANDFELEENITTGEFLKQTITCYCGRNVIFDNNGQFVRDFGIDSDCFYFPNA